MGKKSPKMPPPPDPVAMARAQSQSNIDTARATAAINRINQATPYGSVTYNTRPGGPFGVGKTTQTIRLNPQDQQFLNQTRTASLNQLQRVNQALGGGMSDQAMTNNILARLRPQTTQDMDALRTQLANQGISIGSEAYNNELDRFSRAQNDLRLAAAIQGGHEARASRSQLLNELAALQGLRPDQMSVGVPTVGINPTDTMTPYLNQYNAQLAQWQQANQNRNSLMGSIFGLGGTVLGSMVGQPWLGSMIGSAAGSAIGGGGGGFTNPSALGIA